MKFDFAHDSFFGWLNHFKRWRKRDIWRTPYPVIIGKPTVRQAVWNWNRADTGFMIIVNVLSVISVRRGLRKVYH